MGSFHADRSKRGIQIDTSLKSPDILAHLQMIQDVITRMARCSFQLKQWSIVVFASVLTFSITIADVELAHIKNNFWLSLLVFFPFIGFGLLDAFYLNQERAYRKLFDKVRKYKETDFSMAGRVSEVSYWSAVGSITIVWFYLAEGAFLFSVLLLRLN